MPISIDGIENNVGERLLKALHEEIVSLRQPWVMTPQQMQSDIIDRLRDQVRDAVRSAVNQMATVGFPWTGVDIDRLSIGEVVKIGISVARGGESVHQLADRVGSKAVLVFTDPDQYLGGMENITAQADQPELPLGD